MLDSHRRGRCSCILKAPFVGRDCGSVGQGGASWKAVWRRRGLRGAGPESRGRAVCMGQELGGPGPEQGL